jgi:hypothetical protein
MKKLILILMLALAPCLAYAQGPAQVIHSNALEASHVLKTGPGVLVSLVGYNSGAAQFIQVHNLASVPSEGDTPTYTFTVGAAQNFSLDIPITGARFSTGIAVCNSSTSDIKTIGAADVFFTAVVQ